MATTLEHVADEINVAPFSAERYLADIHSNQLIRHNGKVNQVIGVVIESHGPAMSVGETCEIRHKRIEPVIAEVVGFRDNKVLLMPLGELGGIGAGAEVKALNRPLSVALSPQLLGRVLDGLGRPIDDGEEIIAERRVPIFAQPPDPLTRPRVQEALTLGIRAIDGLLTCGKGQRVGVFSGSGVGKSTVLGMIARNTAADVNVIALVGERGKEVRDFIDRDLGEEGLRRSVVVVATSDQPALIRIKAAMVATTIAEYFRDQGLDVMFMMDSVTRFAMAQREVGLAIGEPTTTRGYTPSVFAQLAEAARARRHVVDRNDHRTLCGARRRRRYERTGRRCRPRDSWTDTSCSRVRWRPPIIILRSTCSKASRASCPMSPMLAHQSAASAVRDILATYKEAEDLINIGAYVSGSNPRIDLAIGKIESIRHFLRQGIREASGYQEALRSLYAVA